MKNRFAIPGMMTSSLVQKPNQQLLNWLWLISLGLCVTITFCLVPFMPLVIVREWPGFIFFFYSNFGVSPNVQNYGHAQTISYTVFFQSIILRVKEVNSQFFGFLCWGATGSKLINSSEPVMGYLRDRPLFFIGGGGLPFLVM